MVEGGRIGEVVLNGKGNLKYGGVVVFLRGKIGCSD